MEQRQIVAAAQRELKDELFRDAVDKEKERIKAKRTLRQRLFPWTILIVRIK